MAKTKIHRTKLFRMVQKCFIEDRSFQPSISDCREVFRNINRNVFNNELRMPNFRLIRSDEYWGECVGDMDNPYRVTIRLNKRFISKRLFIDTLAHEMVHQWEWLNNETMTHGSQFFQWRDELAKYNITLSRSYKVKHYKLTA